MNTPAADEPCRVSRIVFLSRDPVVHEQSGSSTYIFGLLDLLRGRGAEVTLVATSAYSRSPRLFFRQVGPAPAGVVQRFPGYLRLGSLYVLPFRPKAWARALVRAAVRTSVLRAPARLAERVYGPGLYSGAWDLTPPTQAEVAAARRAVGAVQANTIVANYCLWGPVLPVHFAAQRTAILMHDLLFRRAQRFAETGTPLDMPPLSEADEMRWLSGADTVLAAQGREAEQIAPRVAARVVVTPVLLRPRALSREAVVPGRCLFVGSNIAPNRTGLQFLLGAVWPRVRAQVPGATLAVAGTVGAVLGAEKSPAHLASLGIEALGKVPALEPEYARAALCLVPLKLGTGIKIKLLEALAYGKAIVSTSVGIEGLEAWATKAVAVADDPEAYAAAIVRLLTDARHRQQLEDAALACATLHFGPDQQLAPAFTEALL